MFSHISGLNLSSTKYLNYIEFKTIFCRLQAKRRLFLQETTVCRQDFTEKCITEKVVKHNQSICSNTCLPATIKGFPQCELFEDYICNFWPMWNTVYQESFRKCAKHCKWAEYTGELANYYDFDTGDWIIWNYNFDNELIEVYEEYLMYDIIGLIGTTGGTLGLFIGFSFWGFLNTLLDFLPFYKR